MKKYIYAIAAILIMTLGSYTVYGEFVNANNAKRNLSTMNKKHLFASVIDTTNNGEIYNNKPTENVTVPIKKNNSKVTNSKTNKTTISSKKTSLKAKPEKTIKKTASKKAKNTVSKKKNK